MVRCHWQTANRTLVALDWRRKQRFPGKGGEGCHGQHCQRGMAEAAAGGGRGLANDAPHKMMTQGGVKL